MTKLFAITGKPISGEWGTDAEAGNGIPVLRTTNFTNAGKIDYSNVVMRNINKNDLTNKYLKKGDIILEKSGGSDKQPVGRVVYFDGPDDTYLFNNFTGLLRVKEQKEWLPKYVFWALYASYKQGKTRQFENKTTGLHNLQSDAFVKKTDIKQVDFSKQIEISAILDKLRCQIETRKNEINKLDVLVKARFVEMFGDVSKYELKSLAEVTEVIAGGDKPKDISENLTEEYCYPVYANGVTNEGLQCYSKEYRVEKEAVTISARGTIGATFIRQPFFTPIVRLIAVVPNREVNVTYLKYAIDALGTSSTGSSQQQLTIPNVKKEMIAVPPLEKQKEFEQFVRQSDKSKVVVKKISKFHTISQEMCVND